MGEQAFAVGDKGLLAKVFGLGADAVFHVDLNTFQLFHSGGELLFLDGYFLAAQDGLKKLGDGVEEERLAVAVEVEGRAAADVAADLAKIPEVFAVHLVTGRYDIDMLVALKDYDDLAGLMLERLSGVSGIRSMLPAIAVDILKYKFDVAPIEAREAS